MKRYIKPNTDIYNIELQHLMELSGQTPNEEVSNQDQLGKGVNYDTDLWED